MTTHYLRWKHSFAVISSPLIWTILLHYTTPLHCKHSFVPTVKLWARTLGFLLWSSQSLKKTPKHYVNLKIILPFFSYFLQLTDFFFIFTWETRNANWLKVSRNSKRQIWKQKVLRKTDILTQILFTWSSWDKVGHGSIPVRENSQKAWFREEERVAVVAVQLIWNAEAELSFLG